jgi:hypothetical protein
MNIIGHLIIGAAGYSITKEPLFFIGSIIPDIALLPNELKFNKFDKWNVRFKFLYDVSHSLFIPIALYFFNYLFAIAYLLHILIDIPFHTSSFRWKPFLFNKYHSKKKALLLSGGMDSVACALIESDFDCIYFNYGQAYHKKEYPMAVEMAKTLNKDLIVIKKKWHTDIENRNYYLIAEIKKLGYDEVIIGTRNILPLFDKYKDSNWFNLKIYQYLMGIYINMPLIGNFKFQIKNKLNKYDKYYSTESYNHDL